jgi:hypothetical protein
MDETQRHFFLQDHEEEEELTWGSFGIREAAIWAGDSKDVGAEVAAWFGQNPQGKASIYRGFDPKS